MDAFVLLAVLAARILKGEKPTDLPVVLGLTLRFGLLSSSMK